MPSIPIGLRGSAAFVCALLLGCAPAPAAKPAPATAAPVAAKPAAQQVVKAQGELPAGFERLEIVTPDKRVEFFVEFVDTPASRALGLMHRKALAPDRGMLFDFKAPQEVAFWMKNTLIPLDIIYIQEDGTILSIARNATPHSLAPIPSGGVIRGVLEIPGGRAAELGVMPGDRILHRIFPHAL